MKMKSLIKLISTASAVAICVISSTAIMVSSHNEYKEYYDNIIAEKEYQEYLNSLGLEFKGITVTLKDGVNFYTDGCANPVSGDFDVKANFTEKGREFSKKLNEKDYTIETAADFAEKGGLIKVVYIYNPPKEEGATTEPEPITATAEIDIKLIKVALEKIKVTSMPNRVYYSDDMEFDKTGMAIEAIFNNGHTAEVSNKNVKILSTGKLVAGTESVKVSYTVEDVTCETDIPVTVVSKANYTDGEVLSIAAQEGTIVKEGQALSSAKPTVIANYKNGNRLILANDKFTVSGNVEVASFNNNCILTISLKENPNITCKTIAAVNYDVEYENASSTGGNKKTVTEYVYVDDELVESEEVTVMDSFINGDTITFDLYSNNLTKGKLMLRASSMDGEVNLASLVNVKVNGLAVPVYNDAIVNNTDSFVFDLYQIATPLLNKGNNTLEVTYKNVNPTKVYFDKVIFETKYDGTFYETISENVIDCAKNGETPNLKVEKLSDWDVYTGATYIHGICSDGTYIYTARTSYSSAERGIVVAKYTMNGEYIKVSEKSEVLSNESCAGITYYDGKIIIYYANGEQAYINPSLDGTWSKYEGFKFEGLQGQAIRDVSYSETRERFAVLVGSTLHLFNKELKLINKMNIQNDPTGAGLKRMSANNDYIYFNFSSDGQYSPLVNIYDWEGNYVARTVVNNTIDVGGVITATKSTNTQGLFVTDDAMYFSVLKFSSANGGDKSLLIKASYETVKDVQEPSLTVGEYTSYCNDNNIEGSYSAVSVNGAYGALTVGQTGYAMASVSDGKYIYYSMNSGGNANTIICKLDAVSKEVVAKSATLNDPTATSDTSRLFIKDGVLYCIGFDGGSIYSVELNKFVNGCKLEVNTEMKFGDIKAKTITYNEKIGKFALATSGGDLYIARENRSIEKSNIKLSVPSSWKVGSVATDDKYIYVNYTRNSQTVNPIDIYDWGGNFIKRIEVSGFSLGESTNFNLQSLTVRDDQLYAIMCSWDSGAQVYEWKIKFDSSLI